MSEESTLAAITKIVQNTKLTSQGEVAYAGKICASLGNIHPKPSEWQNALQNVIYSECYCNGLEVVEMPTSQQIHKLTNNSFISSLKEANQTKAGWEAGWQVEAVDACGVVWARKGGESLGLYPGEFSVETPWQIPVKPGDFVLSKTFNETLAEDNAFYYVYSQTKPDKEEANLVRFYWNLEPMGAPLLIKEVTTHFNRFGLPFHFKCLRNLDLYKRADAAVLYVSKKYVTLAAQIIEAFYPRLKLYLKNAVPLFCKMLGAGLGFAENPGNGESFGMHRSRLLAQGIVQAHLNNKGMSETVEEITGVLKLNGLSLGSLYLNPFSKYPYQLPILDQYK